MSPDVDEAMDGNKTGQVPEVSWRGLNGNPWNERLNPLMLRGTYQDLRTVKHPQSSGKYAEPIDCFVTYDRNFVIEKICHLVVEPLQLRSKDELLELMDEVWGFCCPN